MKFAHNIRFTGRRALNRVDVDNFLTSDAITSYNTPCTPGPASAWLQPTGLVPPRVFRPQLQFDF